MISRNAFLSLSLCALAFGLNPMVRAEDKKVTDVYQISMKSNNGKDVDLKQYKGKAILFVNVASKCGLTPQYKGLQALHEKYAGKGLVVIGVPSNEFGGQEPGTDEEITAFCKNDYGVTFDLMAKTKVNGAEACALYKVLTSKETNPAGAGAVKWNFTKFLVNKEGKIVGRFEPNVPPESKKMTDAIEKALE